MKQTMMCFANPPQVEGHKQSHALPQDQGMPYTPLTKKALILSFEAHRDQRDKSGLPYVYHPFHLADQMRTEAEACVALLHDVVEDGHLTLQQLAQAGMPDVVVEGVAALSHDLSVPYLDYILGLRDKPVARSVKLADLRHNANLARLNKVKPSDLRRRVKYLMAQALLDDSADRFDQFLDPPQWRKRVPLDDQRLCFVSVFYDAQGHWLSFSYDVEAASDAHYEFGLAGARALHEGVDPGTSFFQMLSDLVATEGPLGPVNALNRLGIPYQSFHY